MNTKTAPVSEKDDRITFELPSEIRWAVKAAAAEEHMRLGDWCVAALREKLAKQSHP